MNKWKIFTFFAHYEAEMLLLLKCSVVAIWLFQSQMNIDKDEDSEKISVVSFVIYYGVSVSILVTFIHLVYLFTIFIQVFAIFLYLV